MKVFTYLRVSTDDQTVEPQRLELANYCARNNWEIVHEFSDVMSGSKASRDGLDAMVARCEQGGIDAVLVVKLDRLGRSVLNVVALVNRLTEMGVAVICTSQGIDTRKDNPCGKMILSIMAAFAEFERDIIRERTRAGLAVARKNGKILGKPSTKLVPQEQRAQIVATWRESGREGGLRGLGKLLGGVAIGTAQKILEAHQ